MDLAGSLIPAVVIDRAGRDPRFSYSTVSSPDAASARDFLFAARVVAARDSHYFSGRAGVNDREMEARS